MEQGHYKRDKNLGTLFNSNFSFSRHVQSVCKSCFVQLRDLRRLRQHLSKEAASKAANALVSSQFYYCNSLFRSLSGFNVRKLQSVQNSLARIDTNTNRCSHVTPVLKSLHWLPVQQWSVFKTATIVYKFFLNGYLNYSRACLNHKTSFYKTRSSRMGVKFLRCHNLFHLFISDLSNLVLVLPVMLPRYGMSCQITSTLPHLFYLFGRN